MEDRYEIRGKIGQGGLGAVYRGYDTRMSREVAIKRISTSGEDAALAEESTRQLIKEASALASLQHPHIVTVYDVGTDEDGPYVVMELLSGKTLDEIIENAPFTWSDFKELALQTQEALIAAHELELIHSDIKPSNLMLTWLPSGKFQIKIVDFGLATLARSQSKEDLEALDAVFGSIFFMPPEQFERKPLDARSDLYSMGCVYYQALTGLYPFNGESGNEVMEAHLHHSVTPLQEIRADIPLWACDWIMWQINRQPGDRPESARDSLSVFLQNEKNPNPTMSLGTAPQDPNQPKRPRLIIPGAQPAADPEPPAEAQPVPEPEPAPEQAAAPVLQVQKPKLQIPGAEPAPAAEAAPAPEPAPEPEPAAPEPEAPAPAVAASLPPDPVDAPTGTKTKTAPQPLTPPEGSKPSVHTSSQEIPQVAPTATAPPAAAGTTGPMLATSNARPGGPVATGALGTQPAGAATLGAAPAPKPAKRKLSNAAKTTIAAILALLVVLAGWIVLNRLGENRKTGLYNEMIAEAAKGDATEVPITAEKLEILLNSVVDVSANEQRQVIYKALYLAKASDGTDVDARIAEFATTRQMLPDVRVVLIRDVLRKRRNPAIIPSLITFARSTSETSAAVAALQAVRFMAGDDEMDKFLDVIVETNQDEIRKAAEETVAEIIFKAADRSKYTSKLATIHTDNVDGDVRHSMMRLLGRCGGPKATEIVQENISSTDKANITAAITALSSWGDDSGFPMLIDFLATTSDLTLRTRAFDAALRYVSDPKLKHESEAWKQQWYDLKDQARTRAEQDKLIRTVVNIPELWVYDLVKSYADSEDDRIYDLSNKALGHIREQRRARGEEVPDDEEED